LSVKDQTSNLLNWFIGKRFGVFTPPWSII
jgi:hypothetical protein